MDNQRKTHRLPILVSEELRDEILQAAQAHNISMGEYVRQAVVQRLTTDLKRADEVS